MWSRAGHRSVISEQSLKKCGDKYGGKLKFYTINQKNFISSLTAPVGGANTTPPSIVRNYLLTLDESLRTHGATGLSY